MTPVAERFWSKVRRTETCWIWTAGINRGGYGSFKFNGEMRSASRVAWMLEHGPIPAGLWVCHHCDNRACVRPSHLFLGTCADNVRDMVAKGRHVARGPTRPAEVRAAEKRPPASEIRRLFAAGLHRDAIAERLGISKSTVTRAVYRHVQDSTLPSDVRTQQAPLSSDPQ